MPLDERIEDYSCSGHMIIAANLELLARVMCKIDQRRLPVYSHHCVTIPHTLRTVYRKRSASFCQKSMLQA